MNKSLMHFLLSIFVGNQSFSIYSSMKLCSRFQNFLLSLTQQLLQCQICINYIFTKSSSNGKLTPTGLYGISCLVLLAGNKSPEFAELTICSLLGDLGRRRIYMESIDYLLNHQAEVLLLISVCLLHYQNS